MSRLALLAGLVLAPQAARAQPCEDALLPHAEAMIGFGRAVRPTDVAQLRDFGRQDSALVGQTPFSLAPDGRSAALILRRGDPETDAYCIGVAVIPLDGGPVRLVDVGGDLLLTRNDIRGIPDLPVGNAAPLTPAWSADGRQIAFLRRDGDQTHVWVAQADGSGARPIAGPSDPRAVRWTQDGALAIRTRRANVQALARIAAEERSGFLYDRRFWTLSESRPRPVGLAVEAEHLVFPDGRTGGAAAPQAPDPAHPPGAHAFARSDTGDLAWTQDDRTDVVLGPAALRVQRGGQTMTCSSPLCTNGVGALWWTGRTLFFLQGGSPENRGSTTLARWDAGADAPRALLSGEDVLLGCTPRRTEIICARETAVRPRHLVAIDPSTGAVRVVFDPNPEWMALQRGTVRRLAHVSASGAASYSDLVLPPQHRAGQRHPMVIVQYNSRGFLRGGTGDEYPVHALAARGFAVLSVQRPRFHAAGRAPTYDAFLQMSNADFAERRHVLGSLEAGVDAALASGTIDADRIGITGLSDGAATVQFALLNANRFHAAALSSCCDEPSASLFAADRGYGDLLVSSGFPAPGVPDPGFWSRYSLAANARHLRTPILMQLTDGEFRLGLETFVTLDHHKVPVELYVFADGHHQKWRPAHRLAVYERAIDWFDFWLNDRVDPAPDKQGQYERWRMLRARQPPVGLTVTQP